MTVALETSDIQGLVVSAYAHLPCAAYRLLRVRDAGPACAWLAAMSQSVTTAEGKQEVWALNVAFTLEGLAAMGLPPEALGTFPTAMHDGGMASGRRSRVLGDVARDAPEHWRWGGPLTRPVHVLLLVYARDEDVLRERLAALRTGPDSGLEEETTLSAGRQPDNREHFGFVDGVGQPVVEGSGRYEHQKSRTGHATRVAAGEFILGYPNQDGVLPLTPTIRGAPAADRALRPAPLDARRRDLGRNGSYLVFRQLAQDVAGFWNAVAAEARRVWPGEVREGSADDSGLATRLAAKMVGRWPSGAPLVLHPDADPFGGTPQQTLENTFTYAGADPAGLACPLGAHIRRANPRDALGPTPETALASATRHRLLRRGRSYGDRIVDRFRDDGVERGLHFICLSADLERQFEFVQQTWLNNPGFSGLAGEVDPLTGPAVSGGGHFTVPADPVRRRACGLRSYVTVVGGAYCFLPGMAALRVLVGVPPA